MLIQQPYSLEQCHRYTHLCDNSMRLNLRQRESTVTLVDQTSSLSSLKNILWITYERVDELGAMMLATISTASVKILLSGLRHMAHVLPMLTPDLSTHLTLTQNMQLNYNLVTEGINAWDWIMPISFWMLWLRHKGNIHISLSLKPYLRYSIREQNYL